MERDARRMRGGRPFIFTGLKTGHGAGEIVNWLRTQMAAPPEARRLVTDDHAPYEGQPHTHPHAD